MKHPSAPASRDGWVLLVRNPANLAHQLLIIFASVTIATMGLPVTCSAQTTAQFVKTESVTVGLMGGVEFIARRKDVPVTKKTARGMANA